MLTARSAHLSLMSSRREVRNPLGVSDLFLWLPLPVFSVAIYECHFTDRTPLQRAEFVDRISHRQQRVGLNLRRKTEDFFYFVFEKKMQCREHGADSEGAAREDDILHRRIDTRPAHPCEATHLAENFLGQLIDRTEAFLLKACE